MMIRPSIPSFERSVALPVLFREDAPAPAVSPFVPLPEPHRQRPEWPLPMPAGAGSSRIMGQFTPSHVYRLRRAPRPEVTEVVTRAPNRIVEILEAGYEEFERTHPLPAHVRKAARMTLQCRTSALGGHVERCPQGHIERVWYNSCGHRFCPRCAYRKQQIWVEKQRQKLLPVRHFHVTFTIPHAFNELWWCNVKAMAALLFQTAAQAVQELMQDPQRVGVQVGIVAALHTWDARLRRHPHLHCLVTGGGLTPEGEWKASSKPDDTPFLVSVKALMQRFRSLFCRRLERTLNKEQLKLPAGYHKQQMLNLLNQVNRTDWDVYVARPVEDGGPSSEEILAYQAHAVAGGPIAPRRLEGIEHKVKRWVAGSVAAQKAQLAYLRDPMLPNSRFEAINKPDNSVSFRWGHFDQQSGRRARTQLCTLPVEHFIQRLLWHVLPPHLQSVRSYGLYASANKTACDHLRFRVPPLPQPDAEDTTRPVEDTPEETRLPFHEYLQQRTHCPVCGKKLELCRIIPSSVTGNVAPRDRARLRAFRRARRRGS